MRLQLSVFRTPSLGPTGGPDLSEFLCARVVLAPSNLAMEQPRHMEKLSRVININLARLRLGDGRSNTQMICDFVARLNDEKGEATPAVLRRHCYDAMHLPLREVPVFATSIYLGISPHCELDDGAIRRALSARGLLSLSGYSEADGAVLAHICGRCIRHRRFGYRGVIVGTPDHSCTQPLGWDDPALERGRYQPWYHVLVDTRDRPGPPQQCYVAHESIDAWDDPPADDGQLGGPIRHVRVPEFFSRYDAGRMRYIG